MIDRTKGALARAIGGLHVPSAAVVRDRLPIDAFVVVGGVLVVLRLLNASPWTMPVLDLHAYWQTAQGISYVGSGPFVIGAYLYAPVFAQVIAPLTALSWPVFAALWTALILAAYVWLVGRWALPILLSVAVALELYLGQIDIFLATAIVIGFRYPAAWAFPLLTKVAPGIGLLWFVARKEWRNLAIAIAATVGIATVSLYFAPSAWHDWFDLLRRSVTDRQTIVGTYVDVPLWLRLPAAAGVVIWGARTNRYWTVPVGAMCAMPILWVNVFSMLVAMVPLREEMGLTPARAWLLRTRPAMRRFATRAEQGS